MAVDRIHLVLEPHLMKEFRKMAEKNRRSVSGQFAVILEAEIERERKLEMYRGGTDYREDLRENDPHLPKP
jgi:hypothetical protein